MTFLQLPELSFSSFETHDLEKFSNPPNQADVWYDQDGKVSGIGHFVKNTYHLVWPGLVHFIIDPQQDTLVAHAPYSVGHVLIKDLFDRVAVPIYLNLRGYQVLHASAILLNKQTIAFSALAGTGKSSTVFGLSQFGYQLWADDALVFTTTSSQVISFKIPFQVRLFPDTANIIKSNYPETLGSLEPSLPNLSQSPLAAICLLERAQPVQGQADLSLQKLHPDEAFKQVLPHAYSYRFQNMGNKQEALNNYLDLVSLVPVYKLTYATPLTEFDQYLQFIIQQFLSRFE